MTDFILSSGPFPPGTSVSAYPVTNWPGSVVNVGADPVGAASETHNMGNASVTFTTLADGKYVAFASVGGNRRYVAFSVGTTGTSSVTVTNEIEIKDDTGAAIPISAAALPLPAGGATSAKQDTLAGLVATAAKQDLGAQDATLTTAVGAAGTAPPSLAATASGLIGWLRKIVDVLGATVVAVVSGAISLIPATSGGLLIHTLLSAASGNPTSVKGSAGQLYGWYLSNQNAAVRYLHLYNKATAPTIGTDTPVASLAIPPGGGANEFSDLGLAFGTGLAYAVTTTADATAGNVAANEIRVNLFYK